MAGKNGKKGNDVSPDEVEDKATPTPETPKAEVTASVEAQTPNPTPEGESTFVSQMMFGQKNYDEQMKVEHNFVGLNRTDEISQLGGASKTEVDLAQMKIFSTERIGDELFAAIERGDTTKVQSLAGLNSDRRMTEAQILVLLKAKREAEEDEGRRLAEEQARVAEAKEEEEAEKELHLMQHPGTRPQTDSRENFAGAGWDEAGNYTDRYGNTYDATDGTVTAADGTQLDPYGLITHTNGDIESIYGDVIPADGSEIQFKDENGNVEATVTAEELVVNPPPNGSPALDADGQKQMLINSYQLYLQSPQGGGMTLDAAKDRAAHASERDLAAFQQQQQSGSTINTGTAAGGPTTETASPSAKADQLIREAGLQVPPKPPLGERQHGVSTAATFLQAIPSYNRWANQAGREYREAYDKWEEDKAAALARGEKAPPAPKRKSIDQFFNTLNPEQAAALKTKYSEALAIDQESLQQKQNASIKIPGNNSTPPVLGDASDPNADPAIVKPVDVDPSALELEQPAMTGYYDEFGGYYDENGGYDDGMGNYYAADGGFYDNKGGYTWPDGAYQDRFGNYVDTAGNLYTSSGQYYKQSDYPDENFKGLLTTNAWKADSKDPFRAEVPPTDAFQTFIDGRVWDPSSRKSSIDSDKPISLFTTKDGLLTTQDTGLVWDPLATPLAVNFGNSKTTTSPWLNSTNTMTYNV